MYIYIVILSCAENCWRPWLALQKHSCQQCARNTVKRYGPPKKRKLIQYLYCINMYSTNYNIYMYIYIYIIYYTHTSVAIHVDLYSFGGCPILDPHPDTNRNSHCFKAWIRGRSHCPYSPFPRHTKNWMLVPVPISLLQTHILYATIIQGLVLDRFMLGSPNRGWHLISFWLFIHIYDYICKYIYAFHDRYTRLNRVKPS